MFERAERDGLWFWTSYQDLWFTPAQLREDMANDRFRWGAVNWELRDPREKLKALQQRERLAANERKAFENALAAPAAPKEGTVKP